MPLPISVRDVKGEPALGQSLREAFRRSVDGTGYAKVIGPLEIVKDLVVQGLIRCKDILTSNINVLGMLSTNNLDATGSISSERLAVSSRAMVGELEVYGDAFFNRSVNFARLINNLLLDRLEVRTRSVFGGFTTILDAAINRLSVLGMADVGNLDVRGSVSAERAMISGPVSVGDRLTAGHGAAEVGMLAMWAAASAPRGWLFCSGQAISRTDYAELYRVIGTAWGTGDGSTTFNLPDMRGRVPIGVGTGAGLTQRLLAATVGVETVALVTAELPVHSHSLPDARNAATTEANPGNKFGAAMYTNDTPATSGSSTGTGNAGSGTAHQNMQPSLAVNFIIYSGV